MRAFAVFFVTSSLFLGCAGDAQDEARFPCGDHGGTCDRASEVCLVGGSDGCSTCAPKPAACDEEASCGCVPPGQDPAWGAFACVDAGVCSEVDEGLVLTCAEVTWGCG